MKEFELVTNRLPMGDPPWTLYGESRQAVLNQAKKKLRKGERIVSLKETPASRYGKAGRDLVHITSY